MLYDNNGIFVGFEEDEDNDILEHYGTPRHSGRYPWGSGDNPYQRNAKFLARYEDMRRMKTPDGKRMFSDKQIAATMNMNSNDLRRKVSLARNENWHYEFSEYKRLKDKGMSRSAIARRMGVPESTLRSWEKQSTQETMTRYQKNADFLEKRVKDVGFVQVGSGTEYMLPNGQTSTTLDRTLKVMSDKGYTIHNIQVEQLGTGKMTTVKVLANPGVTKKEVYQNLDKIQLPVDITINDKEIKQVKPFVSVDPSRVKVVYNEDGGDQKDGLIEVRRGVPDLDIGRNHYVQGRILVDNDHYLKGMITYADDLPDGIDIRFNTNKHVGTPMINRDDKENSVLKPIKKKQENIFGANIKPDDELVRAQRFYYDEDGKEHQSAINIVKEEGDVDKWAKNLASQFASKQPSALAKNQLKILRDNAKAEMDELDSYNNPVVSAKMLEDFASRCERDAVHLQAAALPRQTTKFIMPLDNLKPNEAYVPGYNDGEQVALVRYPHGGLNEIPIVTVNNQNRKARQTLGDCIDAIGINKQTADRLSGADFDGDTVLVLPTDRVKIYNKPQYEGLKDFSTVDAFPGYDGMKKMTKHEKGLEMGKASNLITDMTIQGAPREELERAIKYSMVVIDAEKHGLNWRAAEEQLGIQALKDRYQKKENGKSGGPATLLSRSTSEERNIPERKLKAPSMMSEEEKARWLNGEQIYENTGRMLRDYKKTYPRKLMTKEEKAIEDGNDKDAKRELHNRMWEDGRANDVYKNANEKPIEKGYLYNAYDLTSTGDRNSARPIEVVYADHAEELKDIARQARSKARNKEKFEVNKEARKQYAEEVKSLQDKIAMAEKNAPLEKQAQMRANLRYRQWEYDHPDEDNDAKKRQRGIELDRARKAVGAKKLVIGADNNDPDVNPLTEREWEAIQAHAVTKSQLEKILKNADMNVVKKYAMPKTKTGIPAAKLSRAKRMVQQGYTRAEIASMLDISQKKLLDALEGYEAD